MGYLVSMAPSAFKGASKNLKEYLPSLESVDKDAELLWTGYKARTTSIEGDELVRRPLSGISIKPNTYAFVQVVDSTGKPIKVFNQVGSSLDKKAAGPPAGAPASNMWTDWLLQSVTEQRAEKTQIVETFGKDILYVFGERPRVLSFEGYLLNTADFNWAAEFWENWDKYFRATKAIENGYRVYIGFDDILVGGYPMSAVAGRHVSSPNMISFSFDFFVADYMNTAVLDFPSLQALQQGLLRNHDVRKNEYLEINGFADRTYSKAAQEDGPLAKIIGGDNLRFKEMFGNSFGLAATIGNLVGLASYKALTDDSYTNARGSMAATDALITQMNKEILMRSYQGTTDLIASTPGGRLGVEYFFGMGGLLFKLISQTASNALGPGKANRWTNLTEQVLTINNPYGVASYMGYAASAATSAALQAASGSPGYSNMYMDSDGMLVPKGQSSVYGQLVSARKDPAFMQDASTQYTFNRGEPGPQLASSKFGASGVSNAKFEKNTETKPGSYQLDGLSAKDASKRRELEIAAVAKQQNDHKPKYVGYVVVDDPKDAADDGTDE